MHRIILILFSGLLLILTTNVFASESGRIYGKIHTVDDEIFEGWIRWDKNEAFWDDQLDGTCGDKSPQIQSKKKKRYKSSNRKSVSIFGWEVGSTNIEFNWSGSSCELQFGNMQTIYFEGSSDAIVLLKNGEEVEFTSGHDIGSSVRDILIVDIDEGEIYFDWDDIEKIDFMKESKKPDDGRERLYGKVSTRRGGEFTGWVEWDVDEVFTDDKLDGDAERGRKRKIAFGNIRSIERRSSSSATVVLKEGKEIVLRNSNDVNSGNRGIVVKSDSFGRLKVNWSDFEKVEFMAVPENDLPAYNDFDGGRIIKGTVTTEYGEKYSGQILWDNDEGWTWEHLNGEFKGMEMDIPFSLIASIEKDSRRGAIVTTKSGDSYLLKGSNDVDEDNRGIFVILKDGSTEEIDWYDFEKLEMK